MFFIAPAARSPISLSVYAIFVTSKKEIPKLGQSKPIFINGGSVSSLRAMAG